MTGKYVKGREVSIKNFIVIINWHCSSRISTNTPSACCGVVYLRAPGMARSALTGAVPVHVVVAG